MLKIMTPMGWRLCDVISSHPNVLQWYVRFTTLPIKSLFSDTGIYAAGNKEKYYF